MISVEEALASVLEHSRPLKPILVPVPVAAGFLLAHEVVSSENVPPFDNSAVDGYAVRHSDVAGASESTPVRLSVIDGIHAGHGSDRTVQTGTCIQIMTGAPVPSGADAIVKVEDTRNVDGRYVDILAPLHESENRRPCGDDIRSGQTLFDAGRHLSPYDIGLLASIGKTKVSVIRKPRVAILATGDELIGLGEPMMPGKIRASTGVVLGALLTRMNIPFTDCGIVRDSPEETIRQLQLAFEHDVVLTTGGVSMGEADYVREALAALGVRIHFWKVRQRPGKPLVFGSNSSTLFFGLPGNPVSSLVCFELYVVPSLHRLSGNTGYRPIRVQAVSEAPLSKKGGVRHFLRGFVRRTAERFSVLPLSNQSSGALSSLAFSNGLIELGENLGPIHAGDTVPVLVTDPESFMATAYE